MIVRVPQSLFFPHLLLVSNDMYSVSISLLLSSFLPPSLRYGWIGERNGDGYDGNDGETEKDDNEREFE